MAGGKRRASPGRPPSPRPTIGIGIEISRVVIEFPPVGREATMRVYGRSAGLEPGARDLSSVYIEGNLPAAVRRAIEDLLRPHVFPKLEEEARADGAGEA